MKLKWSRVILMLVVLLVFIIMVVSGAIQIDLIKAWDWLVAGLQSVPGKIFNFISPKPKDFVVLGIGALLGYWIRGLVNSRKGNS